MKPGLLIAEHLGALLVIAMAGAWVTGIVSYETLVLVPLREEASAYHAANVALVTNAKEVIIGERHWRVTLLPEAIEVQSGETQFTFTPRDDAD